MNHWYYKRPVVLYVWADDDGQWYIDLLGSFVRVRSTIRVFTVVRRVM